VQEQVPPPSRDARHLPRKRGRISQAGVGDLPCKQGMKSRVKSKGGAPKGNRNALRTGCHTKAFRQFRRAVVLYARTVTAQMKLLRTLLPAPQPRVVTFVTRPERCYVRTRMCGRAMSAGSNLRPRLQAVPPAAPPACTQRRHTTNKRATDRVADRSRRWTSAGRTLRRHADARACRAPPSGRPPSSASRTKTMPSRGLISPAANASLARGRM
jgi:hypothetical protein